MFVKFKLFDVITRTKIETFSTLLTDYFFPTGLKIPQNWLPRAEIPDTVSKNQYVRERTFATT